MVTDGVQTFDCQEDTNNNEDIQQQQNFNEKRGAKGEKKEKVWSVGFPLIQATALDYSIRQVEDKPFYRYNTHTLLKV